MKVTTNRFYTILFSGLALLLWITLALVMNLKPFNHEHADQHARQALAWQKGNISIDGNVGNLERAVCKRNLQN